MPSSKSVVRRTLADGTVKVYGPYQRRPKKKTPATNTVGWLRRIYLASPDFGRLAPSTKRAYKTLLTYLDGIRHMPVQDVEMGHLAHIRDKLAVDRPGMANLFVGVSAALFKWAMTRGHRKFYNPAHGIEAIPLKERSAWPAWALQLAEAELRGPVRLAFMLGLYTGQRQGDILRMTWAQYDGRGITLRQTKTAEDIYIPAAPALKAALDEARLTRSAVHIVAHGKGGYSEGAFRYAWGVELKRIGLGDTGLVFHGLRHTAATRLAEAGCSEREIMAVTGHKSSASVSRYVRRAKQRTMAESAITRLFPPEGRNGETAPTPLKIKDKL